jgi:hypothetical protein
VTKSHSEKVADAHNQGQSDCADGYRYDNPADDGFISHIVNSKEYVDEQVEINDAYNSGWNNTHEQIRPKLFGIF